MKTLKGHYYDGDSANRFPCQVRLNGPGLSLRLADGREFRWPYAELTLIPVEFEGAPLHFEHPRGPEQMPEVLVMPDSLILAAIKAANPDAAKRFVKPSSAGAYTVKVLALALVGLLASVLFFGWGVPKLAKSAVALIPPKWEDKLGLAVAEEIAPLDERCGDPQVQAALETILGRLTAALPSKRYTYHIALLETDQFNAFAAPGGHVVVFRGLLEEMDSPDELAGILAHEVQHVEQQHSTEAMVREIGLGFLFSAISGSSDFGSAVGVAQSLGGLGYSRDAETRADLGGMALIQRAKLDPNAMIQAYEKLANKHGSSKAMEAIERWLSTHPVGHDRVAALKKAAANVTSKPERIDIPFKTWNLLRTGCSDQPSSPKPTKKSRSKRPAP